MTIYIGHDDWLAEGKYSLQSASSGASIYNSGGFHVRNCLSADTAKTTLLDGSATHNWYFTDNLGIAPEYVGFGMLKRWGAGSAAITLNNRAFEGSDNTVVVDSELVPDGAGIKSFVVESGNSETRTSSSPLVRIFPANQQVTIKNIRLGSLTPLEHMGAGYVYFKVDTKDHHKVKNFYSDEGHHIATSSHQEPVKFSLSIRNHTKAWVNQYYDKMVYDMSLRPFYLYDDNTSHSTEKEAGYCWLSGSPPQAKMNANGLFDMTLSCRGYF